MRAFNIYVLVKRLLPALLVAVAFSANAADLGFGGPSITIISPSNGSNVPAGNVTVSVHIDDFSLVDKFGQANVQGEGHIHYFMDVKVPTTPGVVAFTAPGTYFPTTSTSVTWENVKPGMHNFSVELVNNDHTPLNPPQYSEVNVTVTAVATPLGATNVSTSPAPTTPSGYGY